MAKKTKADIAKMLVTTGKFRVSHPHVFKPSQMMINGKPQGKPAYSIEMLMAKKTTDLKPLQAALRAAAVAEWGPNKEDWPEGLAMPIRDGDKPVRNKKTKEMEIKAEHKGNWVIRASTNAEFSKPVVIGRDKEPLEVEGDLYAGCYARASLKAHAYEFSDKFGVKFILDGVQVLEDGEPLGSRRSAEQMFGALDDEDTTDSGDDSFSAGEDDEDAEEATW